MEAVPRLPMLKVEWKEFQDYSSSDWIETGGSEETVHDAVREQINKVRDLFFYVLQGSATRVTCAIIGTRHDFIRHAKS